MEKSNMPFIFKGNQEANPYSWSLSHFLATSSDNKVQMKNIDEQLKINIRSILNSVSEETVNGIIHALKYAGLESLSDLQFVEEEDLILVLKPIQRRKLVKAWKKQSEEDFKGQNIIKEEVDPLSQLVPGASPVLGQTFIKDKVDPPSKLIPAVFRFLAQPIKKEKVDPLSKVISGAPPVPGQTIEKEKVDPLSKVIPSTPPVPAFRTTIAMPAISGASSSATSITTQSEDSDDENRLEDFETLSSTSAVQKRGWTHKKHLTLLEIYAKYRSKLSCPGVEEQAVWKKIADEARERTFLICDELLCRNKIDQLKCDYEGFKNERKIDGTNFKMEDVSSRKIANFLDRAIRAFETTENPDNFSFEQSSDIRLRSCGKRNKRYRLILLQVYAKYKAELSSPDVEKQKVWRKIAREMRETFFYNCGETLCCLDVRGLKKQYKNAKDRVAKFETTPYFYDEARKAFETTENLDTSNFQMEVNKKISKYIPPHLRNGESSKSESMMSSKIGLRNFTVRVHNLSKDVGEAELQELFQNFGTIARIHVIKNKGYAFVRFHKQEDALQALSALNGHRYDGLILKVGWA